MTVTVDASGGIYGLGTDVTIPVRPPAGSGLRIWVEGDQVIVATLGLSDDKRVMVVADYWSPSSAQDVAERVARWPGEGWRENTARAECSVSDALVMTTAKGKTMQITPGGGRFGMAVFASMMAPGDWPTAEPQEHHILVAWPLGGDRLGYDLPRWRTVVESRSGLSLDVVLSKFADGITPLIRTAFSDGAAWERVVAAVTAPVVLDEASDAAAEYAPNVRPFDEVTFRGLDAAAVGRAYDEDRVGYVLLADARSMTDSDELTVVYVDLYDQPGRFFRCAVDEVAYVEANLSLGNMDFEDFAEHVDPDGVFRGFSQR